MFLQHLHDIIVSSLSSNMQGSHEAETQQKGRRTVSWSCFVHLIQHKFRKG